MITFYAYTLRLFLSFLSYPPDTFSRTLAHFVALTIVHLDGTPILSLHSIRQIDVPGICVTVQEMMDSSEKVGGRDRLSLLKEKSDPTLLPILKSWPTRFDNS